MATQIKITQLTDIGSANLSVTTLLPVVNMAGVPTTQKTTLGNLANVILSQSGGNYAPVAVANISYSVANADQPNITSVGTLTSLAVSGDATVNGDITSNGTAYVGNLSTTGLASITTLDVGTTANLGAVANVIITGGTTGQVLSTDGDGNLSWTTVSGSGGNGLPLANGTSNFNIATADGDATVTADGETWTFGTNGVLALPNETNIYGNGQFQIDTVGGFQLTSFTDNVGSGAQTWVFDSTGDLNLPGNTVIQNGGGITYQVSPGYEWDLHSSDGNVYIGSVEDMAYIDTYSPNIGVRLRSNENDWIFGPDGNLTLPSNTFAVNYANGDPVPLGGGGNANTGNVTFDNINVIGTGNLNLQPDPANAGSYLDIFLTSGPDLHLVASANANLILGKDNQANVMTSWDGNAYVQSWNLNTGNVGGIWTFGGDGSTIFPTLSVQRGDNPSGTITGQTLLFGDNTQEAIISTPDGNSSYQSSQRLVINPGQGYGSGEGGDIYLWAGRGGDTDGNGGDIKIRGGQGVGNGPGGYLRIEAGDSQINGQPGWVEITGGQGGNTTGGYVSITGGVGGSGTGGAVDIIGGYGQAGPGANVSITGGGSANGLSEYGNVNIGSGARTWSFKNDGTTSFPSNTINPGEGNLLTTRTQTGNAYTQLSQESAIWSAQTGDDTTAANPAFALISTDLFTTDTPTVYIQTQKGSDGIVNTWTFDNSGNLILPGSASIIKNNAEVSYNGGVTIQVSDLANAVVASPGTLVGNTYNNTGFTKIIFTDSTLYNALITAGIEPETIVATTWSNGSTTQLNTYVYVQFPGSPDTFSLRPCDANGNTVVGDWVFPSVVGTTVPSNVAITSVSPSTFHTWNFVSDGNLTVPGAIVGAGYSRLDMVSDGPNTAYLSTTNNDTTALYLQEDTVQLYANTNVSITANTGGTSQGWTFGADGSLTLPITVLDVGLTEQTKIRSQRKIIPPFHWSAIINSAFPDPTVVYTATNAQTTSMKVAVQVQHSGLGFEIFDVSATYTGSDTYYSVSNRLKPPTITDTTVLVDLNGSGIMQITLTINSGAKPAWITYDATEFGIPND